MSRWILSFLLFFISLQLYSKKTISRSEIFIDDNELLQSEDSLPLDEEGNPKIPRKEAIKSTYKVISKAENSKIHFIDKYGKRYSNNLAVVEFESTKDNKLSVDIEYSINQSDFKTYTTPIHLKKAGKNIINYKAIDRAGNEEDLSAIEVFVDVNPPTLSVRVDGKSFKNKDLIYFEPGSYISLHAYDNESGIKDVYVSINNEGFLPIDYFTEKFKEPKLYRIQALALDNVLNKSKEYSFNFLVDSEAPVANTKVSNTIYSNKVPICSSISKINISAVDRDSGVKLIYYKINQSDKWINYAGEFKVPEDLTTLDLEYKAIDNVGNESEVKTYSCQIDREPPKTILEIRK